MVKSKKHIFFVITMLIIFIQIVSYPIISQCDGTTSSTTAEATTTDSSAEQSDKGKIGLGNLVDYKGNKTNSPLFQSKLKVIFGALRIIGTTLSVIILIVIGIKYMLGSAEEKADYKKSLIPYLLGTFFIFATTALPQLIYEIVQSIGWI